MSTILRTLFLLLFISSTAISGTIRPDVSDKEVLDYGQKFFCVKKVFTVKEVNSKNKIIGIGSCVILNNNWMITCGHLKEAPIDYIKVVIDNREHCINKLIVNKFYDTKKLFADIALGYCAKGFGDVSPAELYRDKVKLNDYCAIAGYGKHGTMISGAKLFDGKLRAGSNRINSFFKQDMVIVNGSSDRTKTKYEFLPNVGDSGGGLFIDGKLAGITSLVLTTDKVADSKYGDEGAFVQIYPYLEWIEKYVKEK